MSKSEKTFAFEVDTASDVPLWVQLRNRLVYLIESGYYAAGEQLPTVRALASVTSVNYNTVNKAYLSLKSEGYIESTRGRGAFVRDVSVDVSEEYSQAIGILLDDCVSGCRQLGLSLDDIAKCMDAKIRQTKVAEGLETDELPRGKVITIEVGPSAFAARAMNA